MRQKIPTHGEMHPSPLWVWCGGVDGMRLAHMHTCHASRIRCRQAMHIYVCMHTRCSTGICRCRYALAYTHANECICMHMYAWIRWGSPYWGTPSLCWKGVNPGSHYPVKVYVYICRPGIYKLLLFIYICI